MNVTQNGRWFIKIHSYLGYDATKITENFSVAFSWRLSQGFIFQCGGFRAFWRNLVLICLEIQHGIAAASTWNQDAPQYPAWNLKISSRQNCFFNFNGKFFPFRLFQASLEILSEFATSWKPYVNRGLKLNRRWRWPTWNQVN